MHTYRVQEGVTAHGRSPYRALQQVRLAFHKGPPANGQFFWAENAGSSIHLEGRATTQQDLFYSGEGEPLARRGTYRRECLDASVQCSLGSEDGGALAGLFSSRVFPSYVI
jgi:hypothetical protein